MVTFALKEGHMFVVFKINVIVPTECQEAVQ